MAATAVLVSTVKAKDSQSAKNAELQDTLDKSEHHWSNVKMWTVIEN